MIVFDEPTSSLSERDAERLFAIIERLRNRGLAIVYISHFLEEVRRVAQTYTVLRDGRAVADGNLAGTELKSIIAHMVGRDLGRAVPARAARAGRADPGARRASRPEDGPARRAWCSGAARSWASPDWSARAGPRCCAPSSASRRSSRGGSGSHHFEGGYATPREPGSRQGVGFLSEDRKGEGLALGRSIEDNMTYSALRRHARHGWLRLKERRAEVARWIARLRIAATGPRQTGRRPLGRQPAEGGPGPAAPPAGRRPAAGRADARHRRRLQGRDLSPDRRAGRAGQGDPGRQLVSSRAVRNLRPDRRHVARHALRGPRAVDSGPSTR